MSIPDSVTALVQARMDARAAKDFALADKYRDELLQAGFEVVDVAGGYELKPKKPYITLAYPRDIRPIDLETVEEESNGEEEINSVTSIKRPKKHVRMNDGNYETRSIIIGDFIN